MGRHDKLLEQILRGLSDNSVGFDDLCGLLRYLGFEMRVRGRHHLFSRIGVAELVNLQRDGAQAKPYQVRQVRAIILKYRLAGEL